MVLKAEMVAVLESAVLHPGDKLLVRVRVDNTPEQGQALAELLRERLPDNEVTVVGAEQLLVVRSQDPA
jgi:hypothetical protein